MKSPSNREIAAPPAAATADRLRLRHRRRRRRRAARPLPQPGRRRARARPFAHAAEGADRGRQVDDRRRRGARSGGAGRRGRGDRARRAAGRRRGDRRRGPAARGSSSRTSICSSSTSRPGSSSIPAPGHAAGHAGQRADPPLRRQPVGHRRGQAAGHRPSPRQGHLRPAGRRQERRRPPGPRGAVRRPRPQRIARCANIARSSGARPSARRASIDAPLGRHPFSREKMAVVADKRGREAVTHWRCRGTARPGEPRRLPARDRTHPPDPRPSRPYRPSAARRFGLRSGFQDQGEPPVAREARAALDALGRQALHAAILGFDHPITGEPLRPSKAPPRGFSIILSILLRRASGRTAARLADKRIVIARADKVSFLSPSFSHGRRNYMLQCGASSRRRSAARRTLPLRR